MQKEISEYKLNQINYLEQIDTQNKTIQEMEAQMSDNSCLEQTAALQTKVANTNYLEQETLTLRVELDTLKEEKRKMTDKIEKFKNERVKVLQQNSELSKQVEELREGFGEFLRTFGFFLENLIPSF